MKLYDTLSAQKREFIPSGKGVKMYVCGITPYAPAHVGHAMSYVYFDVLRRYLEFLGCTVRHVQNFTDIDDKIIERAAREGVSWEELTERYIAEYFQVMDALRALRAHAYPRATQEVPHIRELIRGLVDKGYAYPSQGDVYFRVARAPEYGKLSHRQLEGMMAGARVDPSAAKEHPLDFTLWKAAKPGEPSWESPWGPGRPGWHIECSSMSLTYLGSSLDIHGGGQDLIFPHHENEIAQTEVYTGVKPFVRFWVHNGLMQLGEAKMSKSLGNLVTVAEALEKFGPDALRLFFLSSHYRSPLTYDEEALKAQERALERLRGAASLGESASAGAAQVDPEPLRQRFLNAMDDDLNTPQALGALFDLAREVNRGHESGKGTGRARQTLLELSGLLGLTLEERSGKDQEAGPFVELLLEVRSQLRSAQQFALADRIRSRLQELGVVVEDKPDGTRWKFQGPERPTE